MTDQTKGGHDESFVFTTDRSVCYIVFLVLAFIFDAKFITLELDLTYPTLVPSSPKHEASADILT